MKKLKIFYCFLITIIGLAFNGQVATASSKHFDTIQRYIKNNHTIELRDMFENPDAHDYKIKKEHVEYVLEIGFYKIERAFKKSRYGILSSPGLSFVKIAGNADNKQLKFIRDRFRKLGEKANQKNKIAATINLFDQASQYNKEIGAKRKTDYDPDFDKKLAKDLYNIGTRLYSGKQQYPILAAACNLDSNYRNAFSEHMLKELQKKSYKERKYIAVKYAEHLTGKAKSKLQQKPVIKWVTTYEKTFVGVGKTGGDSKKYNDGGLCTAESGKHLFKDGRITAIGKNVEMWRNNRWEKIRSGAWIKIERIQPGKKQYFRAPAGQEFRTIVQKQKTIPPYLVTKGDS